LSCCSNSTRVGATRQSSCSVVRCQAVPARYEALELYRRSSSSLYSNDRDHRLARRGFSVAALSVKKARFGDVGQRIPNILTFPLGPLTVYRMSVPRAVDEAWHTGVVI
jgi:hypothetical protein